MKPLYKNTIFAILILVLLIKLFWFAIFYFYLPIDGVNFEEQKRVKALYYRVKLTPKEVPPPKIVKKRVPKKKAIRKKTSLGMKGIELIAIYHTKENTIITVEKKSKATILAIGDNIDGFVLKDGGEDFAIFVKNSKEYTLNLKTKKSNLKINNSTPTMEKKIPKHKKPKKPEGEIVNVGGKKLIDRSLLKHYANNLDEVYKNIGVREVKKNGKIEGFRVSFIKRNSLFSQLGVRRGDIIKKVNGMEMNSYNAGFDLYRNLDKVDNVTIVIERRNKEMELEYEVN